MHPLYVGPLLLLMLAAVAVVVIEICDSPGSLNRHSDESRCIYVN